MRRQAATLRNDRNRGPRISRQGRGSLQIDHHDVKTVDEIKITDRIGPQECQISLLRNSCNVELLCAPSISQFRKSGGEGNCAANLSRDALKYGISQGLRWDH